MSWNVENKNKIKIWNDNWIETSYSLRKSIKVPLNKNDFNTSLSQLIINNNWNLSKLSFEIPKTISEAIQIPTSEPLPKEVIIILGPKATIEILAPKGLTIFVYQKLVIPLSIRTSITTGIKNLIYTQNKKFPLVVSFRKTPVTT